MFIVMISRGFPSAKHPQWGCFEKDQAEALVTLGHKVVVASVDTRFVLEPRKVGITKHTCNGVTYYNSFICPTALVQWLGIKVNLNFRTWQFNRIFKRIVKEYGTPDILFGQFFFNTVIATKAAQKYRIPLVGIEHAGRFNEDDLVPKTKYEASLVYHSAKAVIAVSTNLKNALKRHFDVNPQVVYNTYGKEFMYQPHTFDGTFRMVSTGSLLYGKGFDILINALASINSKMPKWDLQIIGEGNDRQRLEALINKHQLSDKIHLIGKRDKTTIATILQSSDCFILPSRGENFSVAVLEALACGCPVISSDCGDIKACINSKNGRLFPVEDVEALEKELLFVSQHLGTYKRQEIAENCQKQFSAPVIAQQLTTIFQKCLK